MHKRQEEIVFLDSVSFIFFDLNILFKMKAKVLRSVTTCPPNCVNFPSLVGSI